MTEFRSVEGETGELEEIFSGEEFQIVEDMVSDLHVETMVDNDDQILAPLEAFTENLVLQYDLEGQNELVNGVELIHKVSQRERELQKTEHMLDADKRQLKADTAKFDQQRSVMAVKEDELRKMDAKLRVWSMQKDDESKRVKALQEALMEQEQNLNRKSHELNNWEQNRERVFEELLAREEELNRVEDMLASKETKLVRIEKDLSAGLQLMHGVMEKGKSLKSQEMNLTQFQAGLDQAKELLLAKEGELSQLEDRIRCDEENIQSWKNQIHGVRNLFNEKVKLSIDLQKQVEEEKFKKNSLKKSLNQAQERINSLEQGIITYENEMRNGNDIRTEMDNHLQEDHGIIRALEAEVKKSKKALRLSQQSMGERAATTQKELNAQIKTLRESAQAAKAGSESVRLELEALKFKAGEQKTGSARIIKELDGKLKQVQSSYDEAHKENDDLFHKLMENGAQHSAQMEQFHSTTESMETELAQLKQHGSEKDDTITELNRQLDVETRYHQTEEHKLAQSSGNISHQFSALQEKYSHASNQATEAQAEVENLHGRLEKKDEKAAVLESELNDARAELARVKISNATRKADLKKVVGEVSHKIHSLKHELVRTREQRDNFQSLLEEHADMDAIPQENLFCTAALAIQ